MKQRISAGRPIEPMVVYDPDREFFVVRHPFRQFLIDSVAIVFGVLFTLVTGLAIAFALLALFFFEIH